MSSEPRPRRRHRQQLGHRPGRSPAAAGRRLAGARLRPARRRASSTCRLHAGDGRSAPTAASRRRRRCRAAAGCADALVHAAGVLRVGPAGRARCRARRADVAPARRCGHAASPTCWCRAMARGRPRPRRVDRQPRRARHGRAQPVRRDQGGAGRRWRAAGPPRWCAAGRHRQRRLAGGNATRPCWTIRPAPRQAPACRRSAA